MERLSTAALSLLVASILNGVNSVTQNLPRSAGAAVLARLVHQRFRKPSLIAFYMATLTLTRITGRLFNKLGGGFYRSASMGDGQYPATQKMLCDNVACCWAYAEAASVTGEALYARWRTTPRLAAQRVACRQQQVLFQSQCRHHQGLKAVFTHVGRVDRRALTEDEYARLFNALRLGSARTSRATNIT